MSIRDRYMYSPCTPSQADIQEELENMIERQGKRIDELSKKLDTLTKSLNFLIYMKWVSQKLTLDRKSKNKGKSHESIV